MLKTQCLYGMQYDRKKAGPLKHNITLCNLKGTTSYLYCFLIKIFYLHKCRSMYLIVSNIYFVDNLCRSSVTTQITSFTNLIQISISFAIPGYCIERGKAYCESLAAAAVSEKEMLL